MPSAVCEWVAGTTICLGLAGLIGLLPGDLPTDSLLGKESLSAEKILLKCDETESDPSRSDQSELTRDKGLSPLGIELQKRSEVLPFVQLSEGTRGFVLAGTSQSFRPWGFNYDHDERGRLLEDYWESEWAKVEEDFAEMKALGANCVRVHLQFGQFMEAIDKPNSKALRQLERLLRLAEQQGLYLDLTGLGCYHKKDVPAWYDALDEAGRWQAQARFWTAVAERAAHSPAVFCYDLMNEPVVPGGKREAGDWLPPPFGDKHFVQFITLDQGQRTRPEIARAWIRQLVQAIRRVDRRHLITVGLVDWSLDRPGLTSGFVPEKIVAELDLIAVHIYPHKGKVNEALETLRGFAVGKPVVIEESFPLWCTAEELEKFVEQSQRWASGWFFFYWGRTPEQLQRDKDISSALQRAWLERFRKLAPNYATPWRP